MEEDIGAIRSDFDLIAQAAPLQWGHNQQYHNFLLKYIPSGCQQALDVGCGAGEFSCLLAQRAVNVLALDLSEKMFEAARLQAVDHPNINFQLADVMFYPLHPEEFDCIVSIATLHHLPFEAVLSRLKQVLKPGGVLLVLDLFQQQGWEYLLSGLAFPLNLFLRLLHHLPLFSPDAEKRAWAKHALHDRYMTIKQIREVCRVVLPGAHIQRHLFWRYSIIWRKPV